MQYNNKFINTSKEDMKEMSEKILICVYSRIYKTSILTFKYQKTI